MRYSIFLHIDTLNMNTIHTYKSIFVTLQIVRMHVKKNTVKNRLYQQLLELRKRIADRVSASPYDILSSGDLDILAKAHPVDVSHLNFLPGWGDRKLRRYGEEFINTIKSFLVANDLAEQTSPAFLSYTSYSFSYTTASTA